MGNIRSSSSSSSRTEPPERTAPDRRKAVATVRMRRGLRAARSPPVPLLVEELGRAWGPAAEAEEEREVEAAKSGHMTDHRQTAQRDR